MKRKAKISKDGSYRYTLERRWGDTSDSRVFFVMLNPSTADGQVDDNTVTRCINYARRWGYGGLLVGNLFALRSTDPQLVRRDPCAAIGPLNDMYLRKMSRRADLTIVAWGVIGGEFRGRISDVLTTIGSDILCIGTTQDGHPRHPLYAPKDAPLEQWRPQSPLSAPRSDAARVGDPRPCRSTRGRT